MFRNVLAATLRNLVRNRLYAGITIVGLAVAFAAAIMISLFVIDEYSYERFIPGHEAVLRLDMVQHAPGGSPQPTDVSLTSAAALLKLDFPQIAEIARISPSQAGVRRGRTEALDRVTWADPPLFSVLALPTLAGDLRTALDAPDSVVLTRSMARKYFGEDRPVGKTIEVNPALSNLPGLSHAQAELLGSFHPMRVTAVVEDLPSNTHLDADIFASAAAPFSPMKRWDATPNSVEVHTYLRLKQPGSPDQIRRGLAAFSARHYPSAPGARIEWELHLTPLADIHLAPPASNSLKPRGDRAVDAGIALVGLLIVFIAAINFVTLMTARASRRAVEVGVRKVSGASRSDLIAQFVGETLIYVALAMLLGLSLTEMGLPLANAFLQRTLHLDYASDPALWLALPALTLAVGVAAGLYPALVLSAYRPASAMKGGSIGRGAPARARQILVVMQFATMIALIIAATTIYRQTTFALKNSLELDTDRVVSIFTPCSDTFKHEAMALDGVTSAACTSSIAMNRRSAPSSASRADKPPAVVQAAPIDVGFFELHGLKPVAGRFFSRNQGLDVALVGPNPSSEVQPNVILNESAVRRLGFASPQAAIGQTVSWTRRDTSAASGRAAPARASRIVGVVPDFTMGSIRRPIDAALYYIDPKLLLFVEVKLNGRDVLPTLSALDAAVKRSSRDGPVQRTFESQSLQVLYKDVIAQAVVIAVCAGLAVLIAGLGMFALSAFTAERRTKEIGVRRVMGASKADALRLLIWEFTKPVLWASLIAWPLGAWTMTRWLQGFAYRVDLPIWLVPAATVTALIIAWATVATHALLVARAQPALALRYE